MKARRWIIGIVPLLFPVALTTSVEADVITVSGQANLFSAGNNATDYNDWIDPSRKTLGKPAPYYDLGGTGSDRIILFDSVAGQVKFNNPPVGSGNPPVVGNPPDGATLWFTYTFDPSGGISGVTSNQSAALFGVFVDENNPPVPGGAVPSTLAFTAGAGINFTSIAPLLNQVFFIGDGRVGSDGTGAQQIFHAPDGATRLYLGLVDGPGITSPFTPGTYNDNSGAFIADIRMKVVPEPSSVLLGLTGFAAVAVLARRRLAKAEAA